MNQKHYIKSAEKLMKVVEALETLDKHYIITTLDRVESGNAFRLGPPPRWVVEEVSSGNPLEYADLPPECSVSHESREK